jgi:hypothetical protein
METPTPNPTCTTCGKSPALASIVIIGDDYTPCRDACHADAWKQIRIGQRSVDEIFDVIRQVASREAQFLNEMPMLGEDGLDRLAKIALVLQRIRQPAEKPQVEGGSTPLTDEQLMRAGRK